MVIFLFNVMRVHTQLPFWRSLVLLFLVCKQSKKDSHIGQVITLWARAIVKGDKQGPVCQSRTSCQRVHTVCSVWRINIPLPKDGVFPCLFYCHVWHTALPSSSPIFPQHSPSPLLVSSLPPSPIYGHRRSLQVNHTCPTSKLSALKVTTWCFTCIAKHTGTVCNTRK